MTPEGLLIRKIRDKLGLSQEALARQLYVCRRSFQMWEGGKSRPPFAVLELLRIWYGSVSPHAGPRRSPMNDGGDIDATLNEMATEIQHLKNQLRRMRDEPIQHVWEFLDGKLHCSCGAVHQPANEMLGVTA